MSYISEGHTSFVGSRGHLVRTNLPLPIPLLYRHDVGLHHSLRRPFCLIEVFRGHVPARAGGDIAQVLRTHPTPRDT